MNVLLTGGYGCIGSWIVRHLLARGDEVWIYDLREDPRRLRLILPEDQVREVTFVQGDVTDEANLKTSVERLGITHILHLAGLQVPTCRANPIFGAQVNVLGTLAVFEAARHSKGHVERVVYASSAAVYGPQEDYPDGPVADDAPLHPATHYGYFKICNEGNAHTYFLDHGISSVGLRPWAVYGVGRDVGMTSEPTKAIKALGIGRHYHISYGGKQDLQFVDDVARAFVQSLTAPYQGAKAYNLRGHVVDMATFHRDLCSVDSAASRLITFGDRQISIAYDLDDSGFDKDLGHMPRTPLESGIRQTLEAFKTLQAEGRLETSELD